MADKVIASIFSLGFSFVVKNGILGPRKRNFSQESCMGWMIVKSSLFLMALTAAKLSTADVVEDRLLSLESELAELKTGLAGHEVHAYESSPFTFSGFGSFSLTQLSEDVISFSGESDDLSVNPHSLLGIQLNADIAPKTEAVIQVVAEGRENYELDVDWLYVSYGFDEQLSFKAGRFVFAAFMESANAKVGYTYAPVTAVDEIYALTFVENLDGLSLDYRFTWGAGIHNLNIVWGNRENSIQEGTIRYTVENLLGFALESEFGPWQLRFAAYNTDESSVSFASLLSLNFLIPSFKNTFYNVGAAYHDDHWSLQYELGKLSTDSIFIGDTYAHSFLIAWRATQALQPYLQLAYYDTDTPDQSGFFDRTQKSVTLGLRQELRQNISFKYQLKYSGDFKGSKGLFNFGQFDTEALAAGIPPSSDLAFDHVLMGDLSLQFVF